MKVQQKDANKWSRNQCLGPKNWAYNLKHYKQGFIYKASDPLISTPGQVSFTIDLTAF
jgi:hypothetical protein